MMFTEQTESRKMGCARSENDVQPAPLNAPIVKRRTACDGEFNTYAGERDDTALFVLIKNRRNRNGKTEKSVECDKRIYEQIRH